MFKKVATIALCISSLVSASDKIAAKHLMASSQGYNVSHDKNGFHVNGQRVHTYDLDPSLRGVKSSRQLKDIFKSDRTKLAVTKVGNDYALKRYQTLNGGGLGGTTLGCYIGKFSVLFLGHGAILVASALTGPAAPATWAALEGTFGLQIEAASQVGAIAGGIIGGVTTGPV